MYRPRIIPVLLLKDNGLVKSIKFKKHRYIGDPINAVKIFNDKKADELVFLDIDASKERRLITLDFVHKVGDEANMPFAVGGGIKSLEDIKNILNQGAEKVVLNTIAFKDTDFIKESANKFGSSTITVCVDVKKDIFGRYSLRYYNAKKKSNYNLIEFIKLIENNGAGEIIIQSVDRDGTYLGYDTDLIKLVSENVSIPVVALGGASEYNDFKSAFKNSYASAVAAGSIFVYHGPRRAVLINYPEKQNLKELFDENIY